MAIKHNEEFKREAVHIALSSGLPLHQVAADLGVGLSTLGKWLSLRRPDDRRAGLDDDLASENERLRRENRVLREEREILKKAPPFSLRAKSRERNGRHVMNADGWSQTSDTWLGIASNASSSACCLPTYSALIESMAGSSIR